MQNSFFEKALRKLGAFSFFALSHVLGYSNKDKNEAKK
jgi:hypothetical protein